LLAQDNIQRSDPMQQQGRTAGEADLVTRPQLRPEPEYDAGIGLYGPQNAGPEISFLVRLGRKLDDAQTAFSASRNDPLITERRESPKNDASAFGREGACQNEAILANRAKVRGEPIAYVKCVHLRLHNKRLISIGHAKITNVPQQAPALVGSSIFPSAQL